MQGEREGGAAAPMGDGLARLWRDTFSPRMMGFMLNQAWIYTLFFNARLMPASGTQLSSLSILNMVSLVALVSTLLVIGVLGSKLDRSVTIEKRWLLAAAGCTLASTALVPLSLIDPLEGAAILIAAVGTGLGSGSIVALWGKVYSRTSGNVALAEASTAFILAALLLPAYFMLPAIIQAVVVCLIPAVSALFLYRELDSCEDNPPADAEEETHPEDRRDWRRVLAKVSATSVVFGTTVTILRNLFETGSANQPGELGQSFVMSSPLILAGVLMLSILLLGRRRIFALTYRPILPLLAFGCFLLPLFAPTSLFPYFFARVGYTCFDILSWAILTNISVQSSLSPFRVFGLGRAACSGGILLGTLAGLALVSVLPHSPDALTACSGALILLLILASTFILPENDIDRIAGAAETSEADDPDVPTTFSLEEKVAILGDKYQLGDRAREVMLLLAKGRTGARIEQELYISKGTVNYHLRNIYHKLGIHSKQELIELLEKMDEAPRKAP